MIARVHKTKILLLIHTDSKKKREAELKQKSSQLQELEEKVKSRIAFMEESEQEALKSSKGKRLEESECFQTKAEALAQEEEQNKRVKELEKEYGSFRYVKILVQYFTTRWHLLNQG